MKEIIIKNLCELQKCSYENYQRIGNLIKAEK